MPKAMRQCLPSQACYIIKPKRACSRRRLKVRRRNHRIRLRSAAPSLSKAPMRWRTRRSWSVRAAYRTSDSRRTSYCWEHTPPTATPSVSCPPVSTKSGSSPCTRSPSSRQELMSVHSGQTRLAQSSAPRRLGCVIPESHTDRERRARHGPEGGVVRVEEGAAATRNTEGPCGWDSARAIRNVGSGM